MVGGECSGNREGKRGNVVAPTKEGEGGLIPANGNTPVRNGAGFAEFGRERVRNTVTAINWHSP